MEGSAVPDGVLEVSAVPKGVAHVLVVRALGVEDVVQRALASTRSSSGARSWWPGGVYFFAGSLLPAFVGLLVRVTSWCRWCGLRSSDEVLGPLVGGDVEVGFPEQLLGSSRCRCFGSDRTPGVAPQGVFRSRTVSTTVAKWFVPIARGTVDKVYRFGPLRDA